MESKIFIDEEIEPREYRRRARRLTLRNFKWIKKRREEFADLFSEENKNLKKLLLFLWDHNIETVGCCAGHYDEYDYGLKFPYICLYAPERLDSMESVLEILQHVQERCETFCVGGQYMRQKDTNRSMIIIRPVFQLPPKKAEMFFSSVLEVFQKIL